MTVKELQQKREAIVADMNSIIDVADTETRAMNDDESAKFESLEKELKSIDKTIEAKRAAEDAQMTEETSEEAGEPEETRAAENTEEMELRAFDAYIRNRVEERSPVNMTFGANGAVVPSSIANKIIETVHNICPIYADAERYNVKGTLNIPYYDESTNKIVCSYADEFTDGESTSGAFASISLTGFLGRAITDISKSLINNSDFDVVSFVVRKMAEAIAKFIEKELIVGTPGDPSATPPVPAKIIGLGGVTQAVTSAVNTAITADELIQTQELVPDLYQGNAYWIMSKDTRTKIRTLKDGQNNYLLNKDANSRWGYTLFGKDVYTTDSLPDVKAANAGKAVIYYGDMTGLAVKVSDDIEIDVFREVKGRQHVVEVCGFVELDAKVQDAQKLAKLVLHA